MSGLPWRVWLGLTFTTAALAGVISGVEFTLRDPVWPARGGAEAIAQSCLIFFAWSLAPSGLTGATLLLLKGELTVHHQSILVLAGAAAQTAGTWAVGWLSGAGFFPARDLLPFALAGALAGAFALLPRSSKITRTAMNG
jgi:hypothetical protein